MVRRKREVYDLADDYDGKPIPDDTKPTTITLSGKRYSFDLSEANAKKVKEAADVLRKVIASRTADEAPGDDLTAEERRELREWAKANGHKVGDRGRIAVEVVEKWRNR